ncbi:MAG: endonuclease MutS2 [Candidatus Marinimicrobia bacterium]|jgi:DNA mismatch repair protein MutS2|nr:endonuclease MutS2 [Candidatus Neomarinimicrobiota bacterium]
MPEPINELNDKLGFDKIIELIRDLAFSSVGKDLCDTIRPLTDIETIRRMQNRISALQAILADGDVLPLNSFPDCRAELQRCRVAGTFLLLDNLIQIDRLLELVERLRQFFKARRQKMIILETLFADLEPLPAVRKNISTIIAPDGTIRDNASPELNRIRHEIRAGQRRLNHEIVRLMDIARNQLWLHEDQPTIRDGRLVMPLRAESKRKINGVIHGQSATGATVYVEPLEIVEINNALKELELAEKAEIERILRQVTDRIRPDFHSLQKNIQILGELDCLNACAQFGLKFKCTQPIIDENGGNFGLRRARHPLLALHKEVIPLEFEPPVRAVVISGPNAGGKTVAMKTVGLLSQMAMSGLTIPTEEESRLPLITRFLTDIGDQQSIENDLSTFSSHIDNLKTFLETADERSLVLIDELGTGTEPTEGAALGQAVLTELVAAGSLIIVTTHHNALKEFAQKQPGAVNAAMEFDTATLAPTYRLQIGLPGSSYAFEISDRLGLPEAIVEKARQIVGEESVRLTNLLREVEQLRSEVDRDRRTIAQNKKTLDKLVGEYETKLATLREKAEHADADLARQLEDAVTESRRRIENTVKEIREKSAEPATIHTAHQTLAEIQATAQKIKARQKKTAPASRTEWQIGDTVKIEGVSEPGEIIKIGVQNNRFGVVVGGKTLWVKREVLQSYQKTKPKEKQAPPTKVQTEMLFSPRLDLRGMRYDEAESALQRFLDRALLAGLNQVEIIHGKGTGALQKMTQEVLRTYPGVRSFHFEDFDSGGTGATIVEL